MLCIMGTWEVELGTDMRIPTNVYVAGGQFATNGFTEAKWKAVNWNAFFDLTMIWDAVLGLNAAARAQSQNYRLSTSVTGNGTDFCGYDMCVGREGVLTPAHRTT